MSAQRIFQGVALLLCAIVALAGCATSDVRPSIEIGAQFQPIPPDPSVNLTADPISATLNRWQFGASLKTTFTERGPIFEPCGGATLTSLTQYGISPFNTTNWVLPAEVCVTVEPRE